MLAVVEVGELSHGKLGVLGTKRTRCQGMAPKVVYSDDLRVDKMGIVRENTLIGT